MVTTNLNLSMNNPEVVQIHAKQGDSGRLYKVNLKDATEENGTLRILRPDGVEKTSDAESTVSPTITDGMATFDSLEEAEVTELKIALTPKQDLHGYDAPWVGGGGKNKVDIPQNALHQTDYTVPYYYNIIPTTPYALTADQTYTVSFDYEITGTTTKPNFTVGLGNGTNYATDLVSKNSIDTSGRLEFSFTPTSAQLSTYQYVAFRFPRYSGSKTVSWTISNFQLELGDQATSYAPYSNICPIYPSNEINLYQVGKNLFDSNISNLINAPITLYGVSDSSVVNFLNTLEVGNYYLSFKETIDTRNGTSQHNYYGVIIANSATSNIVMRSDVSNPSQGDTFSFSNAIVINESNVGKFTNFWYYCGRATAEGTDTCTFHDFQLEKGTTATAYEPYQGSTHSISLGRSVYGGKVDLVSGKLTIDKGYKLFDGSETWNDYSSYQGFYRAIDGMKVGTRQDGLCNMLKDEKTSQAGQKNTMWLGVNSTNFFVIGVYETMGSTKEAFKTYLSTHNLELVYPLATPIEVDLTPTQISTLLGENNVWSDGEITELTFDYGKLLSVLTADQTAVVGRCLGDVNFTNVSTMPFTLNVIPNNQEETP